MDRFMVELEQRSCADTGKDGERFGHRGQEAGYGREVCWQNSRGIGGFAEWSSTLGREDLMRLIRMSQQELAMRERSRYVRHKAADCIIEISYMMYYADKSMFPDDCWSSDAP